MDYKKDIKDTGIISHISSNKMMTFRITLPKKCERLATAVYLVTNFLSDTEPMKPRLRTLSLDLLRDAMMAKNGNQIVETNVLETLHANISETLSLLELAFIAGLVSEMNFSILKREYASLRDSIEDKKASHESPTDNILSDDFFNTPESPVVRSSPSRTDLKNFESKVGPLYVPTMSDRNTKGQNKISDRGIKDSVMNMSDSYTKGYADLASSLRGGTTKQSSTPAPASTLDFKDFRLSTGVARAPRATTDEAKEARRSRILKLVRDNREVAIRDIIAHFPGISDKTIQRELVAMSDSGVLKKSGERRWSRYSII